MNELLAVTSAISASALICTLVSNFVTDGSTKKIISLVLGAFIICSMIVPIKNAVNGFSEEIAETDISDLAVSTDDEAYSREILKQTRSNLESALKDLLLQNGVEINSCEIILAVTDDNSIIISSVSIYISKEYTQYSDLISEITFQNFSVQPNIITE
ncbi:stage III sporulation protein AF [Ruminococcus sp.]|uniref:stage III sporulation protein AF n=1 Tax=Ruminococcus sp. TaxID=41978 RepID=UPI0025EA2468|nr:stage III sporulation protein AF [Ruminococcus sp.]MCI6616924.1 stage III sporulation protein AF [Ruminococcus sp.]